MLTDLEIAIAMSPLPIGLGMVLLMVMTLGKRAEAFACPECHKLIPVDAILEEGVACHHCGWELIVDSHIRKGNSHRTHFCCCTFRLQSGISPAEISPNDLRIELEFSPALLQCPPIRFPLLM